MEPSNLSLGTTATYNSVVQSHGFDQPTVLWGSAIGTVTIATVCNNVKQLHFPPGLYTSAHSDSLFKTELKVFHSLYK